MSNFKRISADLEHILWLFSDFDRDFNMTFEACAKLLVSFEEDFDDDDRPTRKARIATLKALIDVVKFHGDLDIH
jgi:hypothetical protein